MKRYIRLSYAGVSALEKFNQQMLSDSYFDIQITQPAHEVLNRGGYIYIFKANGGTNVYRVFADDENMQLIFQMINYAFYVNGEEYYDDAIDYAITSSLPIDQWFAQVKTWTEECEASDPDFTEYEY